MLIVKSLHEILNQNWDDLDTNYIFPSQTPPQWDLSKPLNIDDVVLWEQIYREPGNIAIYGSWSPFCEFYLIIHEVFIKDRSTWQIYRGENASASVDAKVKKYGIDLKKYKLWIQDNNAKCI